MQLQKQEIHVWSVDLAITAAQEKDQWLCLSQDERERALRFRFAKDKQRFIAAHYALRQLVSRYVLKAAEQIRFAYTTHKKPYLQDASLQFNLSHSATLALIAFTLDHAIGIDVEKMENDDKQALAARFFSPSENSALSHLAENEKIPGFYRLWSRKEALIKACGKGLSIPLSSFSTALDRETESVTLDNETWTVISLSAYPGYQAAIACNQPIKKIQYWDFNAL